MSRLISTSSRQRYQLRRATIAAAAVKNSKTTNDSHNNYSSRGSCNRESDCIKKSDCTNNSNDLCNGRDNNNDSIYSGSSRGSTISNKEETKSQLRKPPPLFDQDPTPLRKRLFIMLRGP